MIKSAWLDQGQMIERFPSCVVERRSREDRRRLSLQIDLLVCVCSLILHSLSRSVSFL
jgi:hypothetical protein